jgi:hypothetical protein
MLMVFSHFLTKKTPGVPWHYWALLGTIHFFLWQYVLFVVAAHLWLWQYPLGVVAVSTFRGGRSDVLVHVVWQVPL